MQAFVGLCWTAAFSTFRGDGKAKELEEYEYSEVPKELVLV